VPPMPRTRELDDVRTFFADALDAPLPQEHQT